MSKFPRILFMFLAIIMSTQAVPANAYRILVWGDSLSSAYGIAADQGWATLLANKLENRNIQVINASVPGEVSYGGVGRISQALSTHSPDLVIVALGSNDGLQGLDIGNMKENLSSIIQSTQDSGAEVLLLGMRIPPNYGKRYADDFHNTYAELAEQFKIVLVSFFLEPVALDFDLMQADGYHPTAAAQLLLLEHIWPAVSGFLPDQ